jgi:hypothetical protein
LKPTSTPVTPAVPSESSYPPEALNLFKEYDRASYKRAFGVDPPTYDGTKPTKRWLDTSGSREMYSAFVNRGGTVSYEPIDLKGMRLDEVNLYGLHSYAPYVPEPTRATFGINGMAVNPEYLLDEQTANELAWALDARDQVSLYSGEGTPYAILFPEEEKRRYCLIKFKGVHLVAGVLYAERHRAGFNAPGRWSPSGAEPNWISELVTSIPLANPSIPVPQRPLAANEKIAATPFGFTIFRAGEGSPVEPGANGGGGFTSADREMLGKILAAVAK